MAQSLVIVESPAKAKTIGKFLGRRYTVKASMGHLRDLPKSQLGVDVKDNFKPKYITIRGKGSILKELKDAAKKADNIFLATDPDREGEAISWHLAQILDIDPAKSCRITFNEITKESIQTSVKRPRQIDMSLVEAQQTRRILDRLVGYNLSPLLWRKVRKGLSAGRVQSVAVRLICDREREIEEFVAEEYWSICAHLHKAKARAVFTAKLVSKEGKKLEIPDAAAADSILAGLQQAIYRVAKVQKKKRTRNPAPPFTTSSLQQEASKRLGFTTRKTMMIAQQLYEGIDIGAAGTVGLISYIRTDSTRIAAPAQEEARSYVTEHFGADYIPETPRQYQSKSGAQDAHEAIRPTAVSRTPGEIKGFLTKDQLRLYELVWQRFLGSQMSPAILDTVTAEISAAGYEFRATGSTVAFPGFLAIADFEEEEKAEHLPELVAGEELCLKKLEPKQHFTQPPPRYTEAMLVKALEENGIGRPSTYAPTISTIQERGYAIKENKRFVPTELGFITIDLLKEYFADIIDTEFTAEMEERLDWIAEGKADGEEILRSFYDVFAELLETANNEIGEVELKEEVTDEVCEKMRTKYGNQIWSLW